MIMAYLVYISMYGILWDLDILLGDHWAWRLLFEDIVFFYGFFLNLFFFSSSHLLFYPFLLYIIFFLGCLNICSTYFYYCLEVVLA